MGDIVMDNTVDSVHGESIDHKAILANALKLVAEEKARREEVCRSEFAALLKRHHCALKVVIALNENVRVDMADFLKAPVTLMFTALDAGIE